jgi:hypothetical protein
MEKRTLLFFLNFEVGGGHLNQGTPTDQLPRPQASALSRCLLGEKGGEWIVILYETVIVQMIQLNLAMLLN